MCRYYRGDTQTALPVSTEITGYAVAGLLRVEEAAALRAGSFLANLAWDPVSQTFPFELDGETHSAYFFDLGIIARGLLRLAETTGDASWSNLAMAAADSMIQDFAAERGYHPIVELPSKIARPHQAWWSARSGCFQLKAALAWKQLSDSTGESRFADHYERQLTFGLASRDELLAGEADELKVMDRLHAYCYFLEGLLPVADLYPSILAEGIATVSANRRMLESRFVRSDVYAQLLRVRLMAHYAGAVELDERSAECEAAALRTFQIESGDARLDGAFAFGKRNGDLIPHANPVSTIFAVQALDWWADHEDDRFHARWPELI